MNSVLFLQKKEFNRFLISFLKGKNPTNKETGIV
jgi:hypothetical protein